MNILSPAVAIITLLFGFFSRSDVSGSSLAKNFVENVSILQGTAWEKGASGRVTHGNTLPLVGMPWGMVDWSMQNGNGGWFFAPNGKIDGFRATHEPSPWISDYGQFVLMPQSGDLKMAAPDRTVEYDTTTGILRPDYERLDLQKGAITVELTGTQRCGVLSLKFHKSKIGRLILNTFGDGEIKLDGRTIYGVSTANSGGVDKKTFASYFVLKLDRDITKSEIFSLDGLPSPHPKESVNAAIPPAKSVAAVAASKSRPLKKEMDGYVEFEITGNEPVLVKVGTSFISWQQAEQNLRAETEGSFEVVHDRVAAAWNASLGKIEIEASDEQKRVFYSCLYRAQMFPHRLYEINASGKPIHYSPYDGKIHDGVLYGDIGIWDAFRTTFPFLALVYPTQLGEILQGFVNASGEGNGTLPEWPSPGYRRCMIGQHCAAIFADASAKGIQGFDLPCAYESLRKSAFAPPTPGEMVRDGLQDYLSLGYLPETQRYSVSATLDYAYDDWCVAQLARTLGHPDAADALMARAQNYRKLWDPAIGFMRAKDAKELWVESFDPFAWGGPYAESGPWQSSWFVPHDPAGLTSLLGGRSQLDAKLDHLMGLPPTFHFGGYKNEIPEMQQMAAINFGQCALNNQPSFDIPYLYAAIGEPWKTQRLTRRACAELFNASPEGFPGDEDNGSMATWYLLSSIGLFPFCPGSSQYIVTSPAFTRATLHLDGGKTLVVEAPANSAENIYVESRSWNGVADSKIWMSHQDIVRGGVLHFSMSAKPVPMIVSGESLPFSATMQK